MHGSTLDVPRFIGTSYFVIINIKIRSTKTMRVSCCEEPARLLIFNVGYGNRGL